VAKARRRSEAREGPFLSHLWLMTSLRKVGNWSEKQKHPQGETQCLTSRSKSSDKSFGLTFSSVFREYFNSDNCEIVSSCPFSSFFSLLCPGSLYRSVLHEILGLQSWLLFLTSKEINTSEFSVSEGLQIPPCSQTCTPCLGVQGNTVSP